MPDYRVVFKIDIDATSKQEAADLAAKWLRGDSVIWEWNVVDLDDDEDVPEQVLTGARAP